MASTGVMLKKVGQNSRLDHRWNIHQEHWSFQVVRDSCENAHWCWISNLALSPSRQNLSWWANPRAKKASRLGQEADILQNQLAVGLELNEFVGHLPMPHIAMGSRPGASTGGSHSRKVSCQSIWTVRDGVCGRECDSSGRVSAKLPSRRGRATDRWSDDEVVRADGGAETTSTHLVTQRIPAAHVCAT